MRALRSIVVVASLFVASGCADSSANPLLAPDMEEQALRARGGTNTLVVKIEGVPAGGVPTVQVTGPNQFASVLTSSDTLTRLVGGRYLVSASPITSASGALFEAELSTAAVEVGRSLAATTFTVRYRQVSSATGSIQLSTTGLPGGTTPEFVVSNGTTTLQVSGTNVVSNLAAGDWSVAAASVTSGGFTYAPSPVSRSVSVTSGATTAASFRYAVNTGALAVAVTGLPVDVDGAVTVTGPNNFSRALTATTTLLDLAPGAYTVAASAVTNSGTTYQASPATAVVNVTASTVAAPATVTYSVSAPTTGSIQIGAAGLPSGTTPTFTVSSGITSQQVTGASTVGNLAIGNWTVTATSIASGGFTYSPTPVSRSVAVSGGATSAASFSYAVSTGALAVAVTGLPSGVAGAVMVTGPNNFSRALTATTTLLDLAPGSYTVAANSVSASGATYVASPSTTVVTVTSSLVAAPVTVTYSVPAPTTGIIQLSTTGLPSGATPTFTVSNGTTTQPVSGASSVGNLAVGNWTVSAATVASGGFSYTPTPTSRIVVVAGGTTTAASFSYAVSTGALALSMTGLPTGVAGAVTVTGPNNFSRALTANTTLLDLTPGSYTVAATAVTNNGVTFQPIPATAVVNVTASTEPAPATVTYSATTGSIQLSVAGLPSGATPTFTVSNGITSQPVSGVGAVSNLAVGNWTVAASNVASGGFTYAPTPVTRTVAVTGGATTAASFSYAVSTGALAVAVTGLPAGVNGAVTVTGPNNFSRVLTATTTLLDLTPGSYTVAAASVTNSGTTYQASPASAVVTVTASTVAAPATVTYSIPSPTTGSIQLNATGLPGGAVPTFTLSNGATSQPVSGATTAGNLAIGNWTIVAANVSSGGFTYAPTPASRTVAVSGGATSAASFSYAVSTGALAVVVSGLPTGVSGAVTVTGPNNFSRALTATTTLLDLVPGSYTVAAAQVVNSGTTYQANPASAVVTVAASTVASPATVTYAAQSSGGVNLSIGGVYLTQAIQRMDGSVPLAAGRDALLRVFVLASGANTARPSVRVQVYDGATLLQTTVISAPETSVRTAISEGVFTSSWNTVVPGANIRTGTRVLVQLDPNAVEADADRADNTWPSTGSPRAISVLAAPAFNVTMVPITVAGLTGNVTSSNVEQYLSTARRMLPLNQINATVRAPFTSSVTALQSNDANMGWGKLLSELWVLRVADGLPSSRHYYGVVKTAYTSGVLGNGYMPGTLAVGADHNGPDVTAAHEWGHNFGRDHAPCGTTGDAAFPYANGATGWWGWDPLTNAMLAPSSRDLMGYCSSRWISDYNWTAMLQYRSTAAPLVTNAEQDALLVWGQIVDGRIELEPAFRMRAKLTAPAPASDHQVEILDGNGRVLVASGVPVETVDHTPNGRSIRHFVALLPWSDELDQRVARIRARNVRSPFGAVEARSSASVVRASVADTSASDATLGVQSGLVSVRWNNKATKMAMVRDAQTGELLGFIRNSGASVRTDGRPVDVLLSDGVRSSRVYR